MLPSNAIVIGAGIGGLAVACALARQGVAITVLEQARALDEVGAGIQISPNGLAVLRGLGLAREAQGQGAVQASAVVMSAFDKPGPLAKLDLTRLDDDQRYLFLHRSDLVSFLARATREANVSFEFGKSVDQIIPGDLPQVHLTDGTSRRAELIIGADGIHSRTRAALNGDDKAEFTGQVAWRAIVPNRFDHPAEAHVTMGRKRHLVSYPIRGGSLVNLVAVEERMDWAEEGWSLPDDPANLRAAFSEYQGRAKAMIEAVQRVNLWGLHRHRVAPVWHAEGVALLGDAAHPTLPFLAQGANMALEDAWVLTDALKTKGIKQGLPAYQNRREARVTKVIAKSAFNAVPYHMPPGLMRFAFHSGLRVINKVAPGRLLHAYDWLYKVDVTKPD